MIFKGKIQNYLTALQSEIVKQNDELIWANVWHDTAKGIPWISDNSISFSPGRWAVGYNYLYVMTRILNDFSPTKVLDLGLGISTTLISLYYSTQGNEGDYHIVIEHDSDWIKFYTKTHPLSSCSKIMKMELITEKNENGGVSYRYKDLSDAVSGYKFQVISIDAPFGGDVESRSDVLVYLPEILDEDFAIVFDDANRNGERETIEKIKRKLEIHNIEYVSCIYKGATDLAVICSKSNRFLCSL